MVTAPVSFQYKIKTHGIVREDGGRKGENNWNKAVSGLRAEQRIFDELQRQFSNQPCLLLNGFSEQDLIKVVKSKLQKKGRCDALSNEVTRSNFCRVKPLLDLHRLCVREAIMIPYKVRSGRQFPVPDSVSPRSKSFFFPWGSVGTGAWTWTWTMA